MSSGSSATASIRSSSHSESARIGSVTSPFGMQKLQPAMQQALQRSSLVPSGFVVESAYYQGNKAIITVRASGGVGLCPSCGTVSRRVHSRYRRHVNDLPLSGRIAQLLVIARRFRCDAVLCGRQIFTERFAEGMLAPSARRTARLDSIVHHLGLALGGRPAAGFAKSLMLPVSKDTLLRVVRRSSRPPSDPLRVIGIDDWAWRRNHRYASIVQSGKAPDRHAAAGS
jgi:hypothetical protein